jgi:nicotinate-nucleotide pyrophosphorylase (carboxylating)
VSIASAPEVSAYDEGEALLGTRRMLDSPPGAKGEETELLMTENRAEEKARLRPPHWNIVEPVVRRSLDEDLAQAGDLTTDTIVPKDATTTAYLASRKHGRIAGLVVAEQTFRWLDPDIEFESYVFDGGAAEPGQRLARLRGNARAILTAERTALNLLGRLSGIATTTSQLVELVAGTGVHIVDTRKTTPGLRALEKYAVRCGGGRNHRFGLGDAVLIKDNHIAFAGSVEAAVERVRAGVGHMVRVQLEVDSLAQLEQGLGLGIDAFLLDNMTLEQLREAVSMCRGKALTEASGGISPETARAIAETGVDQMSVGWLTHSAPNFDVGLDFE